MLIPQTLNKALNKESVETGLIYKVDETAKVSLRTRYSRSDNLKIKKNRKKNRAQKRARRKNRK